MGPPLLNRVERVGAMGIRGSRSCRVLSGTSGDPPSSQYFLLHLDWIQQGLSYSGPSVSKRV